MFNAMNLTGRRGRGCGRPVGRSMATEVGSMASWANGNYDSRSYNDGYSGQGEDAAAGTMQRKVCSQNFKKFVLNYGQQGCMSDIKTIFILVSFKASAAGRHEERGGWAGPPRTGCQGAWP